MRLAVRANGWLKRLALTGAISMIPWWACFAQECSDQLLGKDAVHEFTAKYRLDEPYFNFCRMTFDEFDKTYGRYAAGQFAAVGGGSYNQQSYEQRRRQACITPASTALDRNVRDFARAYGSGVALHAYIECMRRRSVTAYAVVPAHPMELRVAVWRGPGGDAFKITRIAGQNARLVDNPTAKGAAIRFGETVLTFGRVSRAAATITIDLGLGGQAMTFTMDFPAVPGDVYEGQDPNAIGNGRSSSSVNSCRAAEDQLLYGYCTCPGGANDDVSSAGAVHQGSAVHGVTCRCQQVIPSSIRVAHAICQKPN